MDLFLYERSTRFIFSKIVWNQLWNRKRQMSAAQKGRQPIYEHMHTSNIILKQKKKKCFVGTFTTPRVIFLASGALYSRRKILINRCQHLATFVAASLINLCFLHVCVCVWSTFFLPLCPSLFSHASIVPVNQYRYWWASDKNHYGNPL